VFDRSISVRLLYLFEFIMTKLLLLAESAKPAALDFTLLRIATASLLRSLFADDLLIFRTGDTPLYKVERKQVTEVPLEISVTGKGEAERRQASRRFLFSLCDQIKPEPRQWVIVADPAGIALRNIDHLIPPDLPGPYAPPEVDFFWARVHEDGTGSRDEAGPGLWAVRGEFLPMVLERWREAWETEPAAGEEDERRIWSDVVRSLPIRKKAFERGEVLCPAVGAVDWKALCSAAYVSIPDWPETERWKFLQALYFSTYFGDETGMMVNVLEV
jgi:hypothetical protein